MGPLHALRLITRQRIVPKSGIQFLPHGSRSRSTYHSCTCALVTMRFRVEHRRTQVSRFTIRHQNTGVEAPNTTGNFSPAPKGIFGPMRELGDILGRRGSFQVNPIPGAPQISRRTHVPADGSGEVRRDGPTMKAGTDGEDGGRAAH